MIRTISTRTVQLAKQAPKYQQMAIRFGSNESYTEKQAKKGRPLSPHVTIYKFPTVALSSITNRVTGVILTGGITGIGALALIGCDVPSFMSTIGDITAVGNVAKFAVAFPLTYHYLGGVRHFMWDKNPEMLENDKVEQSSKLLFAGSVALSAVAAVL